MIKKALKISVSTTWGALYSSSTSLLDNMIGLAIPVRLIPDCKAWCWYSTRQFDRDLLLSACLELTGYMNLRYRRMDSKLLK